MHKNQYIMIVAFLLHKRFLRTAGELRLSESEVLLPSGVCQQPFIVLIYIENMEV